LPIIHRVAGSLRKVTKSGLRFPAMATKIASSVWRSSAGRQCANKVAVAVIGLAVTALVGGCAGGDSKPSALPSLTSTSASPSASRSSTTAPTPPAEAREKTSAGAAAFVRFYIGLINDAYRTGASEPLRKYAGPTCDSCMSIAAAVDDIYENGGHSEGGQLTIKALTPTGVTEGVQPTVVVLANKTRFQQFDADGTGTDTVAAEERRLYFDLDWTRSSWLVHGIRSEKGRDL
jgi:hypothetical protein